MWRGLPNGLAKCACSSCFPRRVLNPARVHLLLKESVPCSQNYLLQVTLSSTSDLVSRGGGLKEDRANQFQRSSDVQHHIQTTGSLLLVVVGTGGAGVVRGKQTRLWKERDAAVEGAEQQCWQWPFSSSNGVPCFATRAAQFSADFIAAHRALFANVLLWSQASKTSQQGNCCYCSSTRIACPNCLLKGMRMPEQFSGRQKKKPQLRWRDSIFI